MTASAARLSELLAPVVEETGADLENVDVSKAGKRSVVRVVVDRDGGGRRAERARVGRACAGGGSGGAGAGGSRAVSEALDALDEAEPGVLGPSYVLEVTSPGVDRPLTADPHWRRNVGRLVPVVLKAGPNVTGRITGADGDAITLEVDGAERTLALA